jgi:hypothetical protein
VRTEISQTVSCTYLLPNIADIINQRELIRNKNIRLIQYLDDLREPYKMHTEAIDELAIALALEDN